VLDELQGVAQFDVGFIQFFDVGTRVSGTFHCAECGYGVAVQARLPHCPMCGGTTWERGLAAAGVESRTDRRDSGRLDD
jgi:rubrerythrin